MKHEHERDHRRSIGQTAAAMTAGALMAGSLVAVVLAALLSGCVLSVEPVIRESEGVFEPALLGTWRSVSGRDTAVISRAGESGYRIVFTDEDDGRGVFDGIAARIGDRLVLQVSPSVPTEGNDAYRSLLMPGHLLFVVDIVPEGLRTLQLETDSLRAMLGRGDVWTPHLASVGESGDGNGHLVLTGTTAELRQWLAANLGRAGVLGDRTDWARVDPRGSRR